VRTRAWRGGGSSGWGVAVSGRRAGARVGVMGETGGGGMGSVGGAGAGAGAAPDADADVDADKGTGGGGTEVEMGGGGTGVCCGAMAGGRAGVHGGGVE